ncbi:CPBP family intramembrane glutamic endopeptidase, partial [Hypericibacter sp.]|uniref:CPBP family intramembrane glutamic endopeptidase n=1 Tax=Hypericibacter sp. TaxID=2705401 RepID=UPI003D6CD2CF
PTPDVPTTAPSLPVPERTLRRYDIFWIAGIFALSQLATGVVVILVMKGTGLLPALRDSWALGEAEATQLALVAAIATAGVILAWGGCWLARRRGLKARSVGLGRVRWPWLLAAVILFAAFNWADGIVSDWLDPTGQLQQDMAEGFFPMHQSLGWAIAVAIVIGPVTAFGEEILFRGLLYRWFRERLGIALAALFSAAIFAAVHFYFLEVPGLSGQVMTLEILVFGLIAAGLYQGSGSLWPPMLFHALSNGTVVFLAYAPPPG